MTPFAENPVQASWEDCQVAIMAGVGDLGRIVELAERAEIAALPEVEAIRRLAREAAKRIRDGVERQAQIVGYKHADFHEIETIRRRR